IELERREQLVKNEFVVQARVDDQIALVKATEANIEATEGSLDAARLDLGYTTLEVPFDGTVSATFIERFRNVASGQRILRILDASRIEMEISVPENLIVLEPYVDSIVVSGLPGVKIPAQIARVGTEASSSTRTDPVTIVMEQPEEGEIQLGMAGDPTAEIALPDGFEETGIQIPASVVFSTNTASPDDAFVWVIAPETSTVGASAVEVKAFGDRGLLVSGLEPRARLFNAGANTLTDAQEVHVSEDGS
ncbi:MAG: efflux RND transporter periplasmic adaptor subunit, partial [Planctomycetota bacterium]